MRDKKIAANWVMGEVLRKVKDDFSDNYDIKISAENFVELIKMFENKEETVMSPDYSDTNVSVKVVKLIQSYTDIVNRTVWLKR